MKNLRRAALCAALLSAFLALPLAAESPAGGIGADGLPFGSWTGSFSQGEQSLPFELRFVPGGALFSVPSQAVWLRPVEGLSLSGSTLTVTLSDNPAMVLSGSLSAGSYRGDYSLGGTKGFTFSLKPASLPPRQGTAVSIAVRGASLPGTLLVPSLPASGRCAAVLLLSDSGPSDRDGNSFASAGHSDCLAQLAQALADKGVASLRYDKRGSGESYLLGRRDTQILFSDYVDDACAALDLLKKDTRFDRFTIVGHGEGALVGMAAATRSRVQGLACLAATGRPGWALVEDQLVAALPEGMKAADWKASWSPILESLKAGKTVDRVPSELEGIFRPAIQPYLVSWFSLDPAKLLSSYTGAVAIVQGGNDLKTGPDDTRAMEKAAPKARETFLPDMNHVLKQVPNIDTFNLGSYQDPAYPLASGLASVLADFAVNGLATPLPKGGAQ